MFRVDAGRTGALIITLEDETMRRIVGGAVVLALACMPVASGCAQMKVNKYIASMKGKTAPDFELPALDGGRVRLSDQRGSPVLLAFWAFG
jgi:hypothetical protein